MTRQNEVAVLVNELCEVREELADLRDDHFPEWVTQMRAKTNGKNQGS